MRAKRIRNKRRLDNVALSPQEVIESLKKELTVAKKELEYYKLKEQLEENGDVEEIPEEAVICRPIRGSQFSGVGSRIATKSSLFDSRANSE